MEKIKCCLNCVSLIVIFLYYSDIPRSAFTVTEFLALTLMCLFYL